MYKGIRTWEQLRESYRLKDVLAALARSDQARAYHKAHHERAAEILRKAKELGITGEYSSSNDWNYNPPALVKRPGLFKRIWFRIFGR